MQKNYIIDEGRTGNFMIPGTIIALVGIGLFFIHFTLGLCAFAISIVLFSATNGLEISADSQKYRKYGSFFGSRTGEWRIFPKCTQALLIISSESQTIGLSGGSYGGMVNDAGRNVIKSVTYDIILYTETGERILLYEFLKYAHGKKALKAMTELGIHTENRIAMKMAENRSRARRRGR